MQMTEFWLQSKEDAMFEKQVKKMWRKRLKVKGFLSNGVAHLLGISCTDDGTVYKSLNYNGDKIVNALHSLEIQRIQNKGGEMDLNNDI